MKIVKVLTILNIIAAVSLIFLSPINVEAQLAHGCCGTHPDFPDCIGGCCSGQACLFADCDACFCVDNWDHASCIRP